MPCSSECVLSISPFICLHGHRADRTLPWCSVGLARLTVNGSRAVCRWWGRVPGRVSVREQDLCRNAAAGASKGLPWVLWGCSQLASHVCRLAWLWGLADCVLGARAKGGPGSVSETLMDSGCLLLSISHFSHRLRNLQVAPVSGGT